LIDRESQSTHLFNLDKDPYEETDLAQQHPEKVQELRKIMDRVAEADR